MRVFKVLLVGLIVAIAAPLARAIEFSKAEIAGRKVTVVSVDVRKDRLELFLKDDQGQTLKTFDRVRQHVESKGKRLVFASNAGMYHPEYAPVGLFVAASEELYPLNLNPGQGNFYLKPNGVFLLSEGGARVLESSEMQSFKEPIRLATQSGPLLVRSGKIHPAFKPDSEFRLVRNGVGVNAAGLVYFVQSDDILNLHELARLFRDVLHCPDALYFDGTVSSMYAPALKRNEKRIDLGPIIAVVE